MCLHIGVAGQDVPVGAALGLRGRRGSGQHVGRRRRLVRLASLEPAVDQGHKEQHHAPHHRRHASEGEGHRVVPKVIMEEP